ncbi:MAG: histidine kinase [Lachnospiraceae bacterium]|nr:histidine kinase [Lachnospiraceae bacterium]
MRSSIILQLSVLALASLLVFIGETILSFRTLRNMERENASALNTTLLNQAKNSLDSYYEGLEHTAENFAYSPTVLSFFEQDKMKRVAASQNLRSVFANTLFLDKKIRSVLLYDERMEQIAALGDAYTLPERQRRMRSVSEFSADYYRGQDHPPCFAFYLPIYDLSSDEYMDQLGMCVFLLDNTALDNSLAQSLSSLSSGVELCTREGVTLSFQKTSDLPEAQSVQDLGRRRYAITHGEWQRNGWRIYTAVSIEANAMLERQFHGLQVGSILLSILLFLTLVFFAYARLARPIHSLQSFLKRVIGHPSERFNPGARTDEIGAVGRNLNLLLDEKDRAIHEVRKNKILLYEAEISRRRMQVLAYRNQINPHFLYNTFSAISGMALMNDEEEISEITMDLSDIFRYSIKGGSVVTVADEMKNTERYGRIIEFRFMGKIRVEENIDPETEDLPVIKLLLQPLVENAVFHGLETKMEAGRVSISVGLLEASGERRLRFIVEDDGVGIPGHRLMQLMEVYGRREAVRDSDERTPEFLLPDQEVSGSGRDLPLPGDAKGESSASGIGLGNIVKRLRLFYEKDYTFLISSEEGRGTRVEITVPDHIRSELSQGQEGGSR